MTTWQPVSDAERKQYDCHRMERLTNDAGAVLGSVMQFYDGYPAYANSQYGRIGPHWTFDAAKDAVMRDLEKPPVEQP